jgi:predicted transcriptional regulator of viral defense system
MKTEELYEAILPLEVVTFDEIMDVVSRLADRVDRSYINTKYVHPLVKKGKLRRVRRGIYAVSVGGKGVTPDKVLVASKVKERYFLGYHTALEIHGCAYSAHNVAYVCVKPEYGFKQFTFDQYHIQPVYVADVNVGVEKRQYMGHVILMSSRERTFLDCLDRVEYAGGWEEALKSLENMSGLKFDELLRLAVDSSNHFLAMKTGFILELLKKNSIYYEHLQESTLDTLRDHIGERPRYLVNGEMGELNKRWRLYVPLGFEEHLRGV